MSLTSEPAVALRLSTAMREGSHAEHQAAEGSTFMTELLAGGIAARGYLDYLLRLRVVYAALETTVRDHATDPLVAAVHDPSLERLDAIDLDLAYWGARAEGSVDLASPAALAYAARIEAAAATGGGAVLAHHYTRYLGDLSGGRAIGRILERTFETDGAGVTFYRFESVDKPKPYKDAYRARLDALDLDRHGIAAVVAEVNVAFGLNQALLAELGTRIERYRR